MLKLEMENTWLHPTSDFAGVSAVSTGIAVIAAYFGAVSAIPPGLTAAYFALLSSRIAANNAKGTGIYSNRNDMGVGI